MDDALWSDDELREFMTALSERSFFSPEIDDDLRDRFRRQALRRIVPVVQARLLADIGAATDAGGVARVALDVVEEECWGRRRAWLMATTEPWRHLTELVAKEIRSSYRATVKRTGERAALAGISAASGRRELGTG